MTLGEHLKQLRTEHGWSVAEACDACRVSENMMNVLESDPDAYVPLGVLALIATAYNVDIETLMSLAEQPVDTQIQDDVPREEDG